MPSFPCQACRATFSFPEAFREHYKSAFHHYNLQRKLIELEPITFEDYKLRTSLTGEGTGDPTNGEESSNKKSPKKFIFSCTECDRKYRSKNAFLSHSQRCPGQVIISIESTKSKAERRRDAAKRHPPKPTPEFTELDCLFCSTQSGSTEENLKHMRRVHGFIVPESQNLTDPDGLVKYLGAKMAILNTCLWCCRQRADLLGEEDEDGKVMVQALRGKGVFKSLHQVQRHMIDKDHVKLYFDDEAREEYLPFYSSIVESGDEEAIVSGDEEWEDVSDQELEDAYVEPSTMELVLPTKRLGHRTLRHYYKQKFRPVTTSDDEVDIMLESSGANKMGIVAPRKYAGRHSHATALTLRNRAGTGQVGMRLPAPRVPLIQNYDEFNKMEEKRKGLQLGVSMTANNQKHFRPQVIF